MVIYHWEITQCLSAFVPLHNDGAGGVKKLVRGHSFQRWPKCIQAQSKWMRKASLERKKKPLPTIPQLHHCILMSGDLMVTFEEHVLEPGRNPVKPSALHLICRGLAHHVNSTMWQILSVWNLHPHSGHSSTVPISYTCFCVQPGKPRLRFPFQLHSKQ